MVKNPSASRGSRFDSWVEKIPWRRKWQPTPVFLPGESHGQRGLAGQSPGTHREAGTTRRLNSSGAESQRRRACREASGRVRSAWLIHSAVVHVERRLVCVCLAVCGPRGSETGSVLGTLSSRPQVGPGRGGGPAQSTASLARTAGGVHCALCPGRVLRPRPAMGWGLPFTPHQRGCGPGGRPSPESDVTAFLTVVFALGISAGRPGGSWRAPPEGQKPPWEAGGRGAFGRGLSSGCLFALCF